MECTYDEDLNENQFFQVLQSEQPELFQQATLEGWFICVPRAGSLPKYTLTDEDFFNHILIPSDELPESHFRSLNDKEVRIFNRVISVESDKKPFNVNILFEETFYTDDMFKYKVVCIENPLEPQLCTRASDLGLVTLNSLRDCIDLIWTESSGKEIMEQLDSAIFAFKESHNDFENESIDLQKDLVYGLYKHCLNIVVKDVYLKDKISVNKHLLANIKLAVETYVHHGIYKHLIKGITAVTAKEDSHLNKIIRNSSELQLKDLEIRLDLYDTIPLAKQELSHIDGYSTVLGKIGCLKRCVGTITGEQIVCADDLLPVLIFLVIKVSLPNWVAHLTMLRDFRFSTQDFDEFSFLITSLEAAIEHVKTGFLFKPFSPESQIDENDLNYDKNTIEYLFQLIKYNNVEEIEEILKSQPKSPKDLEIATSLCHPLCSCDKCESELVKLQNNFIPTIHSADDRGCTLLHIAAKLGKLPIIELLLENGARINIKDLKGCTPLHHAASSGHQHALLYLLHQNALPDMADSDGNTPLHYASNNGHEACVKALLYFSEHLGQPIKVDGKNVHGDAALHHASRWGYLGIVQILLEYGARPDLKNNRRISPTDCAHSVHISKLLSNLLMPLKQGSYKKLLLPKIKVAAASKSKLDFVETSSNAGSIASSQDDFLEYGIKPRTASQYKKVEKLLKAITVGDIRLACYYIGLEGNDIPLPTSSTDKQLCHPLCMCEKCMRNTRRDEIAVHYPLPENDEPLPANACNSDGITALHAVATYGRTELIPLLVCAGANINIRTNRGATPLHLACQNKRPTTASALLDVPGCDVNAQDSRGNTPVHYACLSGSAPLVQALLKFSPVLTLRNNEGRTALEEAEDKMALRMVQLLRGKLLISK